MLDRPVGPVNWFKIGKVEIRLEAYIFRAFPVSTFELISGLSCRLFREVELLLHMIE